MNGFDPGRRAVLRGAALTAVTAAGCGTLPALVGDKGRHPCTSRHCRYFVGAHAGGVGHCALALREEGGEP